MNFLELFTKKELIIMSLTIGGLLVLILILFISELISKRKSKLLVLEENNEELDLIEAKEEKSDSFEHLITDDIQEVKFKENCSSEIIQEIKNDENINEIEDLILDDEPVVTKVSPEKINIKEKAQIELLKIEEDLADEPSLEDTINNLEIQEEENAIISYKELLENTNDIQTVLGDDGNEPITLDEVFKLFNNHNDDGIIINELLDSVPLEEPYNGNFISTPYLSPINGIEENENLTDIQLENTANLEKLDKEIRKTNHFLNILNELKKNLD